MAAEGFDAGSRKNMERPDAALKMSSTEKSFLRRGIEKLRKHDDRTGKVTRETRVTKVFISFARTIGNIARSILNRKRARARVDLEFLPPAAEIIQTPPSPIMGLLAWSICALVVVSLFVSWFGRVDIYAVAQGRIQPNGRSKIIQSLYVGTVRGIHVHEGSSVAAGDVLVELDAIEAVADRNTVVAHVGALDAEIARRHTALMAAHSAKLWKVPSISYPSGTEQVFQDRENRVLIADMVKLSSSVDYQRAKIEESEVQRRSLEATIASEDALIDTLTRRVQMRSDLQKQGWDSQSSVLDATETLQRGYTARSNDEGQLKQSIATIDSLKKEEQQTISQFISDYTVGLEKAESDRDGASQDLIKAGSKVRYTRLIAPINGTIQQLTVTTIGQVVSAGEQLMTVVPKSGRLEIEALVENQDIGFVKLGQSAVVKIDAFPFTRYGTMSGTVTRVSRDSLQNGQAQSEGDTQEKPISTTESAAAPIPQTQQLVFPVTVSLESDAMMIDGKRTLLSPGMSGTVEIKTGDRRVIEYILSPFQTIQSESIHER